MLPLKRHTKGPSMKKTISALSLLLFILIVVCAYEKSHTIYAKSVKEHTTPVHNTETASVIVIEKSIETVISPVKEKTVAAKTIEKQIEVKTIAQSERKTPKLPISKSTKEEKEEEETLLAKLKSAVLKRLQSFDTKMKEEETEQSKAVPETQDHQEVKDPSVKMTQHTSEEKGKPVALENGSAVIEDISLAVTYNTSEEEIVDHLVEALKQQDLAFKNRDKFLLEIEALIKRALDDRYVAIAHRKKEELELKKIQKVILEERDLNIKKIPEPYTINPGE